MELTGFLSTLIVIAFPVAILAVIVIIAELVARSPRNVELLGRREVARALRRLDPHHYTVINNVLLVSSDNTDIAQIDHIVVSTYGIFIIETSAHRGDIYGSTDRKEWKQILRYHDEYVFFNPILENHTHERALHKVLGDMQKAQVVTLVAFPMANQLHIGKTGAVGNTSQIVDKIRSHKHETYNFAERASIAEAINSANAAEK